MSVSLANKDAVAQEYLVFRLGDEEYGIDILKVQEIRGCDRATRIPNSPDFITGVTNLRGVIVPIIDLRLRFHLPVTEDDKDTVVIVLNFGDRIVGIVVDGVVDVLSLEADQIRPTPDFTSVLSSDYLLGLGVIDTRMIILVNIGKLLSREEMELMDSLVDGQPR
ncbi:chemotaxis protein CheW [Pantoea sp. NPDC088449]|uniref:Chemotaxis protein CheW n=1 Tax=Candidatus Pantoea floridensis TaxID=1938870 RepID=A0A286BXV6_9GAMM|nr:chemotaxis protein CheW [Pantoea floridensis]PIF21473.1 purine-binding chemotaxis protein CheW [Enterobacteriaceae bacterium JKS000233]SOD38985.1 purine-binding chemotaxis protein CheW [Pantoea floridensis]